MVYRMSNYRLHLVLSQVNEDNEYLDTGIVSADLTLPANNMEKILKQTIKIIKARESKVEDNPS